jgi:periplasmic copper chaperone A
MTRTAFVLVGALITMTMSLARAHDYSVGPLKIVHPWARTTPKSASIGGGYLKITNVGSTSDRFIGGTADVSKRLEIHEMSMDNGVMKMREQTNGLEIKPGETVEFKPSSYHVMFFGLKQPFKTDERIKATLQFEKAGKVDVEFVVEGIGAKTAGDHSMPGMSDGMRMKH